MTEKELRTSMTEAELRVVQAIADRDGITLEEAASQLTRDELAHRVQQRTGHRPAKVYSIRRKNAPEK